MSQNKEKREELESQAAAIQEDISETVTEYKKVGNQILIAGGILAGGLKVSTIPTIYGVLIFLLSLLLWFICDNVLTAKTE